MRLPAWPAALRLPRRTVRLRLTLLYGGLFLVSGMVLLAVTYLLVTNKIFGGQPVFQTNYAESPASVPGGAGGPTIHITERSGPDPLRQLLILSGIALAVMLAVSVALGWLMAGRVLRPLRTITATTRQISEANLHQRLAVAGPDDELKDLADTIDGLLARLDAAFDTQRTPWTPSAGSSPTPPTSSAAHSPGNGRRSRSPWPTPRPPPSRCEPPSNASWPPPSSRSG
jgi:HAMP domain-containing protein